MKKVINHTMIFLFAILFMTVSCSKSNDNPASQAAVNPSSAVVTGTWKISSYAQRTEDKTSQFEGYVFTFNSNGTLKAENGGSVITGTLTYTPSAVSYYGDIHSNASFSLNLGSSQPLSRLSKTWNVDSTQTTSSKIALASPELQENEHFNFIKQ